jgi:hypothetical protein
MIYPKEFYQFSNYLSHRMNGSGSYDIKLKGNTENSNITNGNYDSNFFDQKFEGYSPKVQFEINRNYGTQDLNYILYQLFGEQKKDYRQNRVALKPVFWLENQQSANNQLLNPKIYFNYGYANNGTIQYDHTKTNPTNKMSFDIVTKKPFFFEADRNLYIYDPEQGSSINEYGYDNQIKYDNTQVYDFNSINFVKYDLANFTEAQRTRYFGSTAFRYPLVYDDIFNLADLDNRLFQSSLASLIDSKTLIIPLNTSQQILTTTDRSSVGAGKLDLNTSIRTDVMVIELNTSVPTGYNLKILNIENGSYIDFTWLSTANSGQSGNIQIFPHLGKVYTGLTKLANPLTDYTMEVSESDGQLYFDSFLQPYDIVSPDKTSFQQLYITQNQTINNSILIQTLKTFL